MYVMQVNLDCYEKIIANEKTDFVIEDEMDKFHEMASPNLSDANFSLDNLIIDPNNGKSLTSRSVTKSSLLSMEELLLVTKASLPKGCDIEVKELIKKRSTIKENFYDHDSIVASVEPDLSSKEITVSDTLCSDDNFELQSLQEFTRKLKYMLRIERYKKNEIKVYFKADQHDIKSNSQKFLSILDKVYCIT
ncbi:hypothetical protein HK099_007764 [Clydaea vesicula]|uniref:Uncharacterized protein n=1 Tax=Clydaea vesicula TaxID=447962 RepID=A0AAD5TWR5_9FUNG|nr:hypothetical protein HK099_007764 [Clydaea vesicula]